MLVACYGLEFWNADKQYVKDAWSDFGSSVSKGFAIDMGLWKTDQNKNFWGRSWELLSRFTWQSVQTSLGYVSASGANLFGAVKSVDYYGGATVTETCSENWGAFALGNFIIGNRGIKASPNNSLFQHEYGHYLQSQSSGPFYLQRYAIPSFIDAYGKC